MLRRHGNLCKSWKAAQVVLRLKIGHVLLQGNLIAMNISRIYLALSVVVVLFCLAMFIVLSTPSLQWPGIYTLTWKLALGLLTISVVALLFPIITYGRHAVLICANKKSFAVGYAILVFYVALGIVTILLYQLRAGSGV
jgi:hypothetical protein